MDFPERYELVFAGPPPSRGDARDTSRSQEDTVVVHRTQTAGAGGYPIYEDDTGIVRAEISTDGEIRMVASGGHQAPVVPRAVRTVHT